jgi:hypothetical protein
MTPPKDPTLWDLLWKLLTMLPIEHGEKEALVDILVRSGVLPQAQFEKARLEARQVAIETVQEISRGNADALLEILRKFEGPVQ